jgi:hypothetical protein
MKSHQREREREKEREKETDTLVFERNIHECLDHCIHQRHKSCHFLRLLPNIHCQLEDRNEKSKMLLTNSFDLQILTRCHNILIGFRSGPKHFASQYFVLPINWRRLLR